MGICRSATPGAQLVVLFQGRFLKRAAFASTGTLAGAGCSHAKDKLFSQARVAYTLRFCSSQRVSASSFRRTPSTCADERLGTTLALCISGRALSAHSRLPRRAKTHPSTTQSVSAPKPGPNRCARAPACHRENEQWPPVPLPRADSSAEHRVTSTAFPACV